MPIVQSTVGSLVSMRRLGAALTAQRQQRGVTLAALSRQADHWWQPDELIAFERGQEDLDDRSVLALCRLYALAPKALPSAGAAAVVVDRTSSVDVERPPEADTPTPEVRLASLDVVVARLIAVCSALSIPLGTLEGAEAAVAEALGVEPEVVATTVARVTALGQEAVTGIRHEIASRVVVPGLGLLVADGWGGSLLVVRRQIPAASGGPTPPAPHSAGPLRHLLAG